jgi:putative transposase
MYTNGIAKTQNNNIKTCKYCGSEYIIKYGTQNGTQYYLCKECQHKFAYMDTIPKMQNNTKDIANTLNMYYEGLSLNEIRRNFIQQDGNYISKATPYNWVHRFTELAKNEITRYKPNIGTIWIADEAAIKINGKNVWLWDLIDTETRFLISSHLTEKRSPEDVEMLMEKACKCADKYPELIYANRLNDCLGVIRQANDSESLSARHIPFEISNNAGFIERFRLTSNGRIKVIRNLKSLETAQEFLDGWAIHYNFFRPHTSLKDRTPAELAEIKFPYKSWREIIEQPYEVTAKIPVNHTSNKSSI